MHRDLQGQIMAYENFSKSKTAIDKDGHGSHVCGILAGKEGGRVVGVAPKAKLYIAKALDDSGYCSMESLTSSVNWCRAHKVHLIVMSLGAPPTVFRSARKLKKAIQAAHSEGIAIFAAAGNSGKGLDIPARWKEVFSVGAIDADGNVCGFSAKGQSIDFCGYGFNIFSTYKDGLYAIMSGTSAAVPGVAGVAALVISRHPGISPDQLRERMIHMCQDHAAEGWDEGTGWGLPVFGVENGHMTISQHGVVDEDPPEEPGIIQKIKSIFSRIF